MDCGQDLQSFDVAQFDVKKHLLRTDTNCTKVYVENRGFFAFWNRVLRIVRGKVSLADYKIERVAQALADNEVYNAKRSEVYSKIHDRAVEKYSQGSGKLTLFENRIHPLLTKINEGSSEGVVAGAASTSAAAGDSQKAGEGLSRPLSELLAMKKQGGAPLFGQGQDRYVQALFKEPSAESFFLKFHANQAYYTHDQRQAIIQTAKTLQIWPETPDEIPAIKEMLPRVQAVLQRVGESETTPPSNEELLEIMLRDLSDETRSKVVGEAGSSFPALLANLHSLFRFHPHGEFEEIADAIEQNRLIVDENQFAQLLRAQLRDGDTVAETVRKARVICEGRAVVKRISDALEKTTDNDRITALAHAFRRSDNPLSLHLSDLLLPILSSPVEQAEAVFDRALTRMGKHVQNGEALKHLFSKATKDRSQIDQLLVAIKPENQRFLHPIVYPLLAKCHESESVVRFESWARGCEFFALGQSKYVIQLFSQAVLSKTPAETFDALIRASRTLTEDQKRNIRLRAAQIDQRFPALIETAVVEPLDVPMFSQVPALPPGVSPVTHDAEQWKQGFDATWTMKGSAQEKRQAQKQLRAKVFADTSAACTQGYTAAGVSFAPNPAAVAALRTKTRILDTSKPLSPSAGHKVLPVVEVVNMDALDATEAMQQEGMNPATLNMANRYHMGGGVVNGAGAQEECLFRCTNAHLSLAGLPYPLPEKGSVAVSKGVTVFRRPHHAGYAFRQNPFQVNLISCAAYCCKKGGIDRYDRPDDPAEFREGMRQKLLDILRAAVLIGCDSIVLGAFGCGAFEDDAHSNRQAMFDLLPDILASDEFNGRFKKVTIAVLDYSKDTELFSAFHTQFNGLFEKTKSAAAPSASAITAAASAAEATPDVAKAVSAFENALQALPTKTPSGMVIQGPTDAQRQQIVALFRRASVAPSLSIEEIDRQLGQIGLQEQLKKIVSTLLYPSLVRQRYPVAVDSFSRWATENESTPTEPDKIFRAGQARYFIENFCKALCSPNPTEVFEKFFPQKFPSEKKRQICDQAQRLFSSVVPGAVAASGGGVDRLLKQADHEWITNALAGGRGDPQAGFERNTALLSSLIDNPDVSDEQLFGFLCKHTIRATGGFFSDSVTGLPTRLSEQFAARRKSTVPAFFKKQLFDQRRREWRQNSEAWQKAVSQDEKREHERRNSALLEALITDTSLSNLELLEFFLAVGIRPDGGWFRSERLKGLFTTSRGLDVRAFFSATLVQKWNAEWNTAPSQDEKDSVIRKAIAEKNITDNDLYQLLVDCRIENSSSHQALFQDDLQARGTSLDALYRTYGPSAPAAVLPSSAPVSISDPLQFMVTLNSHGAFSREQFALPPNVYVLAPHPQGFDAPYTLDSPPGGMSFEEMIYRGEGAATSFIAPSSGGWRLYRPGEMVRNLRFSPWSGASSTQIEFDNWKKTVPPIDVNAVLKVKGDVVPSFALVPARPSAAADPDRKPLAHGGKNKQKVKVFGATDLRSVIASLQAATPGQPIILIPFACNHDPTAANQSISCGPPQPAVDLQRLMAGPSS